jgi:hypothetical protein
MKDTMERTSRAVAIVCLLASAAFFAWYGLALGATWPASIGFFAAATLTWLVAAVGVSRALPWGPSFAAGLSAITTLVFLPVGLRPVIALFLGIQVVLHAALAARAVSAKDHPVGGWRHAGLGFALGLAAPWVLVVGLLPGLGCGASMLGLVALLVAGAGAHGVFRGRTWGLFALLGAVPLLLAVPPHAGCHPSPHDAAGELASVAIALALVPWIAPVARVLRGRPAAG